MRKHKNHWLLKDPEGEQWPWLGTDCPDFHVTWLAQALPCSVSTPTVSTSAPQFFIHGRVVCDSHSFGSQKPVPRSHRLVTSSVLLATLGPWSPGSRLPTMDGSPDTTAHRWALRAQTLKKYPWRPSRVSSGHLCVHQLTHSLGGPVGSQRDLKLTHVGFTGQCGRKGFLLKASHSRLTVTPQKWGVWERGAGADSMVVLQSQGQRELAECVTLMVAPQRRGKGLLQAS